MATMHAYGDVEKDHAQFDAFLKNGPTQTGVMAGVVAMAGQAASQFGGTWPLPELTAVGFALLLAVYNVRMVQRLTLPACAVLVPIVTLVLFVTGWGANGLVYETRHRGQDADSSALLRTLTAEKANLHHQVQSQQREIEILRRLSGLPTSGPSTLGSSPALPGDQRETSSLPTGLLDRMWGWLVPAAHAQGPVTRPTPTPPSADDRARLLRELQEQEEKQQSLRSDGERLRKQREKAEQQGRKQSSQPDSLWRRW